jgi:DNA-binding winged helix-turn-helix (wHTH) protein
MRVAFDRFLFDSERRELLDANAPVHIGPKAFQLLQILLERAPRALSKNELLETIWPDTVIDESGVAGLVNELRKALGDSANKPRYIRTVHGFGYAFCGPLPAGPSRARAGSVVYRNQEIALFHGPNVLGRDANADVCVDDSTVSRRHATITIDAHDVSIEDLDSKNGTFVDGKRVKGTMPLNDGQTVLLGDAPLVFRGLGASTSTVSAIRVRDDSGGRV